MLFPIGVFDLMFLGSLLDSALGWAVPFLLGTFNAVFFSGSFSGINGMSSVL
jgi:hypothetical protein